MTCDYVTSGCNYPDGECGGACMQGHTGAQIVQFPQNRNPIEIDGPYRREPRIYTFINWLCAVIFCLLVLALWTGALK